MAESIKTSLSPIKNKNEKINKQPASQPHGTYKSVTKNDYTNQK